MEPAAEGKAASQMKPFPGSDVMQVLTLLPDLPFGL